MRKPDVKVELNWGILPDVHHVLRSSEHDRFSAKIGSNYQKALTYMLNLKQIDPKIGDEELKTLYIDGFGDLALNIVWPGSDAKKFCQKDKKESELIFEMKEF